MAAGRGYGGAFTKEIRLEQTTRELGSLMRELRHPDRHVRRDLVRHLFYSDDPRSPALLARIAHGDRDTQIRFLARKALGLVEKRTRMDPERARRFAIERMGSTDVRVRQAAIRALARRREPATLETLLQLLPTESDPYVRATLTRSLPVVAGDAATASLRDLLGDSAPRVRLAAVEGLAEVAHPGVGRELLLMLLDGDSRVQMGAGRALLGLGLPAAVLALQQLLESGDPTLREGATRVLQLLRIGPLWDVLGHLVEDEDQGVRVQARAAREGKFTGAPFVTSAALAVLRSTPLGPREDDPLAHPDPAERLERIQELVDGRVHSQVPRLAERYAVELDATVRATLVIAMGILQARDRRDVLERALSDVDSRVRANAVEAISLLDDPSVLSSLVPVLTDSSPRVRANAIVALKNARGVDVLGPLVKMLASEDPRLVMAGIYAATDLDSSEATLALRPCLDRPEPGIKQRALEALEVLRRGGRLVAGALMAEALGDAGASTPILDLAPDEWEEAFEDRT